MSMYPKYKCHDVPSKAIFVGEFLCGYPNRKYDMFVLEHNDRLCILRYFEGRKYGYLWGKLDEFLGNVTPRFHISKELEQLYKDAANAYLHFKDPSISPNSR